MLTLITVSAALPQIPGLLTLSEDSEDQETFTKSMLFEDSVLISRNLSCGLLLRPYHSRSYLYRKR